MKELSKPIKGVDLSKVKCNQTSEYRDGGFTVRPGWTMRLTLETESGAYLPLFVHVHYNSYGRLEAEIESDQTDYTGDTPNVKRAYLKNLRFWG